MKVLLLLLAASGLSRNPDISLVRVPNGGIQPEAIIDRGGTLHLLYYLGDPIHGDLFYVASHNSGAQRARMRAAKRDSNSLDLPAVRAAPCPFCASSSITWSSPLRVNSQPGTAIATGTIRGGQIAIGQNGRVHIAWNGSSKAEPAGMFYSRLNDARTGFEPERNLMTHTFGLDGGGTVAADSSGGVYVAWHGKAPGAAPGEAGRQVWIAKSENNGKTFAAEQPAWQGPTGACGCCGMAMFADTKGIVRALYRSATGNIHRDIYLLTSQDHGRSFDGRKLHAWDINACPMSSMAFAEAAGKVEGAWETDGQVYFENLTTANTAPISALGESKGHKHPRIAIAPNGDTLMAWTEGTGWSRGGSLAWQLYDASGKPIGEKGAAAGVPVWSFGSVVAKPSGFIVIY
jgi:hypothetical protein